MFVAVLPCSCRTNESVAWLAHIFTRSCFNQAKPNVNKSVWPLLNQRPRSSLPSSDLPTLHISLSLSLFPYSPMCIQQTPNTSAVTKSSNSPPRRTNSRKRVRFEHESEHFSPKRRMVVDDRPLCKKELTLDEKRSTWFQADEQADIVRDCKQAAQDSRKADNCMVRKGQGHFAFSETYRNVYGVCHLADLQESSDMCSLLSTEVITFLALKNEAARGLEDWTVPLVALERRAERKKVIHSVLQVQQAKFDAEKLCQVSQSLSRPARKLAQAVGVTDATAAMLEYRAMVKEFNNNNNKKSSSSSAQTTSSELSNNTRPMQAQETEPPRESSSPILAVASS